MARSLLRRICAVAALVASGHGAGRALAQSPSLQVTLDAPPECGDLANFERSIDQVLGQHTDHGQRAPLAVHAEVAPSEGRLVLRLSITSQDGSGVRELSGTQCGELMDAAALVVGLAIDPVAVNEATARQPPSAAPPDALPAEQATQDTGVAPLPPIRSEPRKPLAVGGYVGPLAVAEVGALPGVGAGVALSGGLRLNAVSIELSGTYLPPRFAPLSTDEDKGGTLRLWSGQLGVCYRLTAERSLIRAEPCLGLEAGALFGRGSALQNERAATEPWLAATVSGRAGIRLGGPVSLAVSLQAAVPIASQTFEATPESGEAEEIHTTGAVSGRALAGLFVNFPWREAGEAATQSR